MNRVSMWLLDDIVVVPYASHCHPRYLTGSDALDGLDFGVSDFGMVMGWSWAAYGMDLKLFRDDSGYRCSTSGMFPRCFCRHSWYMRVVR